MFLCHYSHKPSSGNVGITMHCLNRQILRHIIPQILPKKLWCVCFLWWGGGWVSLQPVGFMHWLEKLMKDSWHCTTVGWGEYFWSVARQISLLGCTSTCAQLCITSCTHDMFLVYPHGLGLLSAHEALTSAVQVILCSWILQVKIIGLSSRRNLIGLNILV